MLTDGNKNSWLFDYAETLIRVQIKTKIVMAYIIRKCDNCGNEYEADTRNLKRGWGLCCSKSCAAKKREKGKQGYNPKRVARNNAIRAAWGESRAIDSNLYGDYTGRRTSEGYKIYGTTACNEWGEPEYDVGIGEYDEGDSEYWNNSDNCRP